MNMNLMEGRKEEVPDWKKLIVKNKVLVLTTKEQLGLTVKKEAAAVAEKRVVARADLRIRSLRGGEDYGLTRLFFLNDISIELENTNYSLPGLVSR